MTFDIGKGTLVRSNLGNPVLTEKEDKSVTA